MNHTDNNTDAIFFIVCNFCNNYHFIIHNNIVTFVISYSIYYSNLWYSTAHIDYNIDNTFIRVTSIPACDVIAVRRLQVFAAVHGSSFGSPIRSRIVIKRNCITGTRLTALLTFGFDLPSGIELCPSSMCFYYHREYKKFVRVVHNIACFCPSQWQN